MGTELIGQVITALNAAGLRAARARPAGEMPELTQTAVAVSLHRVDGGEKTITVLIRILTPCSSGGQVCEAKALTVWSAVADLGGVCTLQESEYDPRTGLYEGKVYALFQGAAAWSGWADSTSQAAAFSVKLGSAAAEHLVSFTATQTLDTELGSSLSAMTWQFRLEELFAPGDTEATAPTEPFTITVTGETGSELYRSCTFTSLRREVTPDGLRQIRSGTAASRSVVTLL